MNITKYREKLPCGFAYWGEDLDFERPVLGLGENKATVTRIMKACKNCIVEEDKSIYISAESFSELLRTTSKCKLKIIVSNIPDEEKLKRGIITHTKSDFIAFGEVFKILLKEHFEAVDDRKRMYLKVAEIALLNMRDCDTLAVLAFKNDIKHKDGLKKLKKERIKTFKIKFDELTGEKIKIKEAEFHHIRSKSSYPKLALDINNGLIVGKDTHDIITKSDVENEEQLEELCIENGWSTSWVRKYKSLF